MSGKLSFGLDIELKTGAEADNQQGENFVDTLYSGFWNFDFKKTNHFDWGEPGVAQSFSVPLGFFERFSSRGPH